MSARSSEQNMMAFSSWQMSHWSCESSGCAVSDTRSCFWASLFAECTLRPDAETRELVCSGRGRMICEQLLPGQSHGAARPVVDILSLRVSCKYLHVLSLRA